MTYETIPSPPPPAKFVGGLRSLGIDPDDFCDEVPKPDLATIPKRKLTKEN